MLQAPTKASFMRLDLNGSHMIVKTQKTKYMGTDFFSLNKRKASGSESNLSIISNKMPVGLTP